MAEDKDAELDIDGLVDWALRYRETFRQPTTDPIVNSVIHRFVSRHYAGMIKYETTMYDNPLSAEKWLEHAQEELMDGILYLERLKRELQKDHETKWLHENLDGKGE